MFFVGRIQQDIESKYQQALKTEAKNKKTNGNKLYQKNVEISVSIKICIKYYSQDCFKL